MQFIYDRLVIVKRYFSTLGKYNRPQNSLEDVARYECHIAKTSSVVAQRQPQKVNAEEINLYTYPEANIEIGDVLYIYTLDEYGNPIMESEYKTAAGKPYQKRTQLIVPLLNTEEV
ncbi:hypothetical protein C3V36_10925 [Lachnospiraceae bacterium oral taxon 500]|nr:hypothetical protein C3V36_10925 [Lachnospiraceae bacterium oral taxon 500]